MSSRVILFFGVVFSFLYLFVVVQLNNSKEDVVSDELFKFAFLLKNNQVEVVSKLPEAQKNGSLLLTINRLCDKYSCDKNIKFSNLVMEDGLGVILTQLLKFIDEKGLHRASVLVTGDALKINFLVSDTKSLEEVKKIYQGYRKLIVVDNSSVLKYVDIASLQNSINSMLEGKRISFKNGVLSDDSQALLKKVCFKLKGLGEIGLVVFLDIPSQKKKVVENYLLKSFPWIKDVFVETSNKNKIKIKEVAK